MYCPNCGKKNAPAPESSCAKCGLPLGPVVVHKAGAKVCERRDLEIPVAKSPADRDGVTEAQLPAGTVGLEHAGVEGDPSGLDGVLGSRQSLRPRHPAPTDGGVAHHGHVHPGERTSDSNGAEPVACPAVAGVGSLPPL